MLRIIGRVKSHYNIFLHYNIADNFEVQHFSDIKNHEKIAFLMPRIMGRARIRGPSPSSLIKNYSL